MCDIVCTELTYDRLHILLEGGVIKIVDGEVLPC